MKNNKNQPAADLRASMIAELASQLEGVSTIYLTLRRRAKSGSSLTVSVSAIKNNAPTNLDCFICGLKIGGATQSSDGHARVSGCGTDMGHFLADAISQDIYGGTRKFSCGWI